MVLKWLIYLTGSRTSQAPVVEDVATTRDEARSSVLNGQATQGGVGVDDQQHWLTRTPRRPLRV